MYISKYNYFCHASYTILPFSRLYNVVMQISIQLWTLLEQGIYNVVMQISIQLWTLLEEGIVVMQTSIQLWILLEQGIYIYQLCTLE